MSLCPLKMVMRKGDVISIPDIMWRLQLSRRASRSSIVKKGSTNMIEESRSWRSVLDFCDNNPGSIRGWGETIDPGSRVGLYAAAKRLDVTADVVALVELKVFS